MLIRLGHSLDPDDAFVFSALGENDVDTRGFAFEHVLRDLETLNEWALDGRLEVTTLSLDAYPLVQDRYVLLPHGASIGSGYAPVVVAPRELSPDELREVEIAVPGPMAPAFLVLRMFLGEFAHRIVPADEILEEVAGGRAAAGLVTHDGRRAYEAEGLVRCVDLGEWWLLETGLPLPLSVKVARRDLGEPVLRDLSDVLRDSIEAGLARRRKTERAGGMHAGELTCDYGDEGREAVRELLRRAEAVGAYRQPVRVEFV